ncbi:thiamine phosphate synthase [Dokdonia sp. 4H-3-7-5]|uniref:thiamine phosphate synthase n=1 Tax=Dokdonia sp. (strain 4H-3-7-5) TaxID=983548 RepID=UPI00020A66B1|nr:thiamine phosphate synthase [Dokdonia sp. 4H-3-7-5]AEE20627.1 thiamine monophosphate synthase [Dokdonia sp. 4H-3-7-5]
MIPKLHYISQGNTPEAHLDNLQKACSHGATLVQLRLKNVPLDQVLIIAREARTITAQYDTKLIINDHYEVAKEVKADGVHLGKTDSCPTVARAHLYSWQIIGGTANTLEDCLSLRDKGVDYIGLGPLRFTTTKKNLSPVLGYNGYHLITETLKTKTPIIAIGGITVDDVTDLLETGIHGIAVSGEITHDFTKIEAFQKSLGASFNKEQHHTLNNI